MSAALEFTRARFGGNTAIRERSVAVDAAQVVVLPNDPDRLAWNITNTANTNITLSFLSPISEGDGMLLLGNGATADSDVDVEGMTTTAELLAISDVAGGRLRVVETVRVP